jgi:choline dehydrogenase-like flavoprotein
VRRRFNPSLELLQREKLLNIAFWPEFPPIHDPRHGDGVLSMAYLALSIPPVGRMVVAESVRRVYVGAGERRVLRHLRNIMKDVTNTATFVPRFLWRRKFSRPRQPGFFQRNAARRYAIRFHAETRPELDNRITLGDARDAVGLRRAVVDLSFRRADVEDVLRAHTLFGEWLERTGVGRMEWSAPPEERVDHVLAQAVDGHHQIGTTRMAQTPAAGVVDRDCRVFGAANLYLAGASVFPTSSQANPTFPAILLAMRLARHLADQGPA